LDLIFWIQSPVAPVLIYTTQDNFSNYHTLSIRDFNEIVLQDNMKLILP
jgi:hypothetical protein